MAGDKELGFWGSVTTDGTEIMVNLRKVRYAVPQAGGTQLVFAADDAVQVTADFATVSRRLYEAYDPQGDAPGGKDESAKPDKKEGGSQG